MPKEDVYTINQSDVEEDEEEEEIEEPKKRISTPYIVIIVLIVLIIILIAIIVIMILVRKKSNKINTPNDQPIKPDIVDSCEATNATSTIPIAPAVTPAAAVITGADSYELPDKVFNDHADNIANAINEGITNTVNIPPAPSNSTVEKEDINSQVQQIQQINKTISVDAPGSTEKLPAIEDMLDEAKKGREQLIKTQSAETPEPDNAFTENIGSIDESEKARFNFDAMNNIIV